GAAPTTNLERSIAGVPRSSLARRRKESTVKHPVQFVVYTRDRHPADHCSFQANGGAWPAHCVDGTPGFGFHPDVKVLPNAFLVDKGTRSDADAYSGFDRTGLTEELRERGITRVVVAGLATDYCVKATALDALAEGFETWVATDAVAAVDVHPGDGDKALLEMRHAGAMLAEAAQIENILTTPPQQPTALVVVDMQRDFCPGGALAVADAPHVFGPLRYLINVAARP
ncbi:MAG: isochorismatase family protein, partial [Planctomycetia bacterium]